MKEIPILFNTAMVNAILSGQKSMTRRAVKPQPKHRIIQADNGKWYDADCIDPGVEVHCQFQVGVKMWVRETWKPHCEGPISDDFPLGTCVKYRADGVCLKPSTWTKDQGRWCEANEEDTKWRSSLFMPQWASRITLKITDVRAEMLQDISEADALAEGIDRELLKLCHVTPQNCYRKLWDSIYSKTQFNWQANPWVFVVEFKRV